jgi:cell division protease FtsH
MAGGLGPVTYESEPNGFLGQVAGTRRLYAEETAREIDVEIRDIVSAAFERARTILAANRELLDESARVLLARETLAGEDLAALLRKVRPEGSALAAAAIV